MTDDDPTVDEALGAAERLVRDHTGEPVTLDLYDAVGRAISEAHVAAHRHPVEDLLGDVKADTDAVEDALLALWHDDGDGPRTLTDDTADALTARLNGDDDTTLPEPTLAAYDAADAAREDTAATEAAERLFRLGLARAAWEGVEGDRRAAEAALTVLPDDVADDLQRPADGR